jgi:glutamyl-tRNA synthetase
MSKKTNNIYRFAPSPTGFLHVGGARTAIFNWLIARKNGGKFLLRIEDTDKERSSQASVEQIFSSLQWLGIDWDGDPVYQSRQQNRHYNVAHELLAGGKVYRCFCTPESLKAERQRAEAEKKAFVYDGRCQRLTSESVQSNLNAKKPFALRLKIVKGETVFDDLIRGEITVNHDELDDFVILRSDGTPMYHLAVVVDDHDMEVTHIIRGDDHLPNTPKQILIYQALGWKLPLYAHLPLVHGFDGARLSKRHGATSVDEFREKGYLPEALFNYLCLLGWAPGGDREILSRDEIISLFSLEKVNKKNAVFDEKKLKWMDGKFLSQQSSADIIDLLRPIMNNTEWDLVGKNRNSFEHLIDLVKTRAQTLPEVYEAIKFYFNDPPEYDEKGLNKYFRDENALDLLKRIENVLKDTTIFGAEKLEEIIRNLAELMSIKAGDIIHPLRLALTGFTVSPGIFDVMQILGKEVVLRRINKAIDFIGDLEN